MNSETIYNRTDSEHKDDTESADFFFKFSILIFSCYFLVPGYLSYQNPKFPAEILIFFQLIFKWDFEHFECMGLSHMGQT